jgi:septation ring formation regulator EzrA
MAFDARDRVTLAKVEATTARIEAALLKVQQALGTLQADETKELANMASYKEEVGRLTATVQKQTGLNQSALTLIQGMAQQLRDLATDPNSDKVDALADAWENSADSLATALEANPETPPEPAPEEPV